MSAHVHSGAGFTLLETLAVVAITGFLITSLTSIYVGIMRNSERATDATRDLRVTAAVLDRVARDLERAYVLVRDEADDPLAHPWLFVAESHAGQLGADRVMFTTLSHTSSTQSDDRASGSGLATYAYWLEGDEELGYDLLRWVNPRLANNHRFPNEQDEGAVVVADGIAAFSLHFLDELGGWVETWDSTALVDSSELPVAVEVRLALPPQASAGVELGAKFGETSELREYRRRVVLYQRPVSHKTALGLGGLGAGGDEDEDEEGISIYEDEDDSGCKIMSFAQCFNLLGGFDAAVGHLDEDDQAAWQGRLHKCVAHDDARYPFPIERCR